MKQYIKWKFLNYLNDCDAKTNKVINVELNEFKFVVRILLVWYKYIYNIVRLTKLQLIQI